MPVIGLTAAAAGFVTTPAVSAEWTLAPNGSVFTLDQQNPNLVPGGKDDSVGYGGQASLDVKRRTERLSLDLQSSYGVHRYRRDDNLDRDEANIDLAGSWQGERVDWSGSLGAARDTTLTSELGTTGLTQGNSRHESYDFSIGPNWQASERVTVGARAGLNASRYPGLENSELVDYDQSNASVYVSYLYSDRLSLTLSGAAGRLSSKGSSGDDTRNANATIAARYALATKWSLQASVGPSLAESQGERQRGLVYGLSVSRAFERAALSIDASRSQEPAGRGLLTELQRVGVASSTQLTERLSATASVGLTKRTNAIRTFDVNLDEVKYGRADFSLGWRVSSTWQLGFSVGGTDQRRDTIFRDTQSARGYDARLALSWNGNPYVH